MIETTGIRYWEGAIDVQGSRVTGMKEHGQSVTFSLSNVKRVYEKTYALQDDSLDDAWVDVQTGGNRIINEPAYALERDDSEAAEAIVEEAIDGMLPENERDAAHELLVTLTPDADYVERKSREIESLRRGIWQPFLNRARVLEKFGYLDIAAEKGNPAF